MPRLHLKPLDRQVIVITGASSGMGLATALGAAAAGARVFLIARNGDALSKIAQDIGARGGTAAYADADVGDPNAMAAAVRATIARFGRIDTWVNNAGVAIYAKLEETPLDEHERLFRTNYFGVVNGSTAALPHLRAQGGALITVGSIVSDLQTPTMGAYAASKHAVKGYIDSLRTELTAAGDPISVTLIKPSGTDTPIARHAANHLAGEAKVPPPVYDPELVARAILDAAVRPRREVTVGGVGRAGELLGQHMPGLLDRLAGALPALLEDRTVAKTPTDNLFAPVDGGEVRSGRQSGRSFSLYTASARHNAGGWMMLAGATAIGLYLAKRASRGDQA